MSRRFAKLLMGAACVPMAWVLLVYLGRAGGFTLLCGVAAVVTAFVLMRRSARETRLSAAPRSDFYYQRAFMFALLAYLGVQLIVGPMLMVTPSWDFGAVYNTAISGEVQPSAYVNLFPHNALFTYVCTLYYGALLRAGVTPAPLYALFFNVVVIDASLCLLFAALRRLFDAHTALWASLAAFAFAPLLAYAPIAYTDTFSLLFVCGALLIEATLSKEEGLSLRRMLLLTVLEGVIIGLGFKVKASVAIIAIAAVLSFVAFVDRARLKQWLLRGATLILALLLTMTISEGIMKAARVYDPAQSDQARYPYTHWIMMGLKDVGGWNQADVDFTSFFPTYSEKAAATKLNINARLRAYGFSGLIRHQNEKIAFTWTDGTYTSSNKLSRQPLHDYAVTQLFAEGGDAQPAFQWYCDVYHCILVIGVMLSFAAFLFKPQNRMHFLVSLAVAGLTAFLMIWETRARYLLHFYPLMLVAAIYGYRWLYERRWKEG